MTKILGNRKSFHLSAPFIFVSERNIQETGWYFSSLEIPRPLFTILIIIKILLMIGSSQKKIFIYL